MENTFGIFAFNNTWAVVAMRILRENLTDVDVMDFSVVLPVSTLVGIFRGFLRSLSRQRTITTSFFPKTFLMKSDQCHTTQYNTYFVCALYVRFLSHVKRRYCFRFFCPSVCPGRFFSARNSSHTFYHTQSKPISYERVSYKAGVHFSVNPKFRRGGSLKTARNHKFQFLERHKSMSFWRRTAILYHMKALLP